ARHRGHLVAAESRRAGTAVAVLAAREIGDTVTAGLVGAAVAATAIARGQVAVIADLAGSDAFVTARRLLTQPVIATAGDALEHALVAFGQLEAYRELAGHQTPLPGYVTGGARRTDASVPTLDRIGLHAAQRGRDD